MPDDVTADRVRRPERYACTNKPPKRKTKRKTTVLPGVIEAEVATFAKHRSTTDRRVKDLRRILGNLLDAGFDIDSPTLLQDAIAFFEIKFEKFTALTRHHYRTLLHAFLAYTYRLSDWEGLVSRAQGTIASGNDMQGLLLVRKYAECAARPIPPAQIDVEIARKFLLKAQMSRETSRCFAGLASLDVLRAKFPELLPTPAIDDQRDWLRNSKNEMPTTLEGSLRVLAEGAGYSSFSVKDLLTAARCLYELTPDKAAFDAEVEVIPWEKLIAAAVASHPQEMLHYRAPLKRLAVRVSRVWTPGWRDLQAQIAQAGISRAENPVDTMMEVAQRDGLEPWQLDREWAWIHERSLRPDLRRKWVRAIDNFDALCSAQEIDASGLLPAGTLGPMPKTGSRLKNAHFPLPRSFEASLKGATKQLLESAHFVWRCLRELEVYSRGDDPSISALLSEENLVRVMREQPFMTAASARLHLARIRDWRESGPGAV